MNNKYTPAQQLALYSGALMLLLALPLKWYLTRFGINFCDEPLLMLTARDYTDSPMTALSCFISGSIAEACGFTWIDYRYLSYAYFFITLALPCWYLWYKTRNLPLASFTAGFLFLLAAVWHNDWFSYFGYDTPSAMMIAVTLILMLEYIDAPTQARALLLGLSTSIAALMRAPDIAMAPLAVLAMLYCGYRQRAVGRSLLHAGEYIAALLATAVVGVILLFGGIGEFLGALSGGADDTHDLTRLIMPQVVESCYSVLFSLALLPVYAVFVQIEKIGNWRVRRLAKVVAVIALGSLLYLGGLAVTKPYNPAFTVTIALCMYIFLKSDSIARFKILVIVCFCAISAAGSNTGVHKINYFMAAALALIYYVPRKAALCTAFSAMLALVAFYTRDTLMHGFFDRGVIEARTPVSVPFMDGMLTNAQQALYIERIDSIYGKFAADTAFCTVAISNSNFRYYFELVYDSRNPVGFGKWSMDDRFDNPEFVQATMEYIETPRSKPTVVLYLREDGSYYKQPHFTPTLMENALHEQLDSIEGNDLCTIYIKR